jgi:hypothetical protein
MSIEEIAREIFNKSDFQEILPLFSNGILGLLKPDLFHRPKKYGKIYFFTFIASFDL